jgi:hypothetical protein
MSEVIVERKTTNTKPSTHIITDTEVASKDIIYNRHRSADNLQEGASSTLKNDDDAMDELVASVSSMTLRTHSFVLLMVNA